MGGHEVFVTDGERFVLALSQEITASVGIGIPSSRGGGGCLPIDGADTIEQTPTINHTGGHLFEVVRISEVITSQLFWLQGSAIAIELHFRWIRESCLFDEGIRQLIEARLGNTDLRPSA